MHDYLYLKSELRAKTENYQIIGDEMQALFETINASPDLFGDIDASILNHIALMAMALAMNIDANKQTIH